MSSSAISTVSQGSNIAQAAILIFRATFSLVLSQGPNG